MTCFSTGITGQDGSYLGGLLLEKNCEVHGITRHSAIEDPRHRMSRIEAMISNPNRKTDHP